MGTKQRQSRENFIKDIRRVSHISTIVALNWSNASLRLSNIKFLLWILQFITQLILI